MCFATVARSGYLLYKQLQLVVSNKETSELRPTAIIWTLLASNYTDTLDANRGITECTLLLHRTPLSLFLGREHYKYSILRLMLFAFKIPFLSKHSKLVETFEHSLAEITCPHFRH